MLHACTEAFVISVGKITEAQLKGENKWITRMIMKLISLKTN